MPLQDAFHIEMRVRMKEMYYEKGGKARSAYKRFMDKYELSAEEFFKGNEDLAIEEKVKLLQIYSKTQRKPYTKKTDVIVETLL